MSGPSRHYPAHRRRAQDAQGFCANSRCGHRTPATRSQTASRRETRTATGAAPATASIQTLTAKGTHMANFDLIVIGAGVTGLTAAKAAVQSGLKTANIEALMFGGLVVNVNELDGETTGSGTDYASNLMM